MHLSLYKNTLQLQTDGCETEGEKELIFLLFFFVSLECKSIYTNIRLKKPENSDDQLQN